MAVASHDAQPLSYPSFAPAPRLHPDAPEWFNSFFTVYFHDIQLAKQERAALLEHIEAQDKQIKALESRIAALESAEPHIPPVDTNEVLFSGIPNDVKVSSEEAVCSVLEAMDLKPCAKFIASTRLWKGPEPQSPHDNCERNPPRSSTYSLVAKFVSSTVRDQVIASSSRLNKAPTAKILGKGGPGKIYCRALWPKPVYALLSKAREARTKLNYLPPVVQNLTVIMRKSKESPPIPVRSTRDIEQLKPRITAT